jgi:Cysteine-rich CWC
MSAPPEPVVTVSLCPLCRRANGCAMASGEAGATPCWCFAADLDRTALARAFAVDGGASCVCAACAAKAP